MLGVSTQKLNNLNMKTLYKSTNKTLPTVALLKQDLIKITDCLITIPTKQNYKGMVEFYLPQKTRHLER